LLRQEVLEQLAREAAAVRRGEQEEIQPFLGLAKDWRQVLFPKASDHEFADGYAQTLTFALLLARSEEIDLDGRSLHDIGDRLSLEHPLMGRALQLLTDTVSSYLTATLDLLRRVVVAVQWAPIRAARADAYLRLYEDFLEVYDEDLRRASGSYYTPHEVVAEVVRLLDEVLRSHLGHDRGFASPDVAVIDPAMGTGTFLYAVINRVIQQVAHRDGQGTIRQALAELPSRLVGFDIQMGPFAVATLRWSDLVHRYGARPLAGGFNLYLTNTLDDPFIAPNDIASAFLPLSLSQKRASAIKARQPVEVILGNPPYRERANGSGGWVEHGGSGYPAPLGGFKLAGNGRTEYVLRNCYVYFWRWATWKLFEAHPDHRHGVVAFISTAGYLRGPGFKGMREYLRRTCDEGWIIDLSPEGIRPDVSTRIFPGVQQPLAIGIFVRRRSDDARHSGPDSPARIWYAATHGRREDKYARLADLTTSDHRRWLPVRDDWPAPFTPAALSGWDELPALGDLMPWVTPGVKPNRTWVYAPAPEILHARWAELTAVSVRQRRDLLKETGDRKVHSKVEPLPGVKPHTGTLAELANASPPSPERVAYRSFDRQWIVPDNRVLDRPRAELWRACGGGNVFVNEQHARPLRDGPGIVLTTLPQDMDHFKGSEGGRVLPMRHAAGVPNAAPGLLDLLGEVFGRPVEVEHLVAYLAGVVAHTGFTERFADDLVTPGIRVPLTLEPALWTAAVSVGREVAWLHTYGDAFADPAAARPANDIRYPEDDPCRPQCLVAVEADRLPSAVWHDAATGTLHVGSGEFGPVPVAVWQYSVGGMPVVRKWLSYRRANRAGRTSSRLDSIHADRWPLTWTSELNELLTVVRRLVDLEPAQATLLDRIAAGPLLTTADLAAARVLPVPSVARRPHRQTLGGELPPFV
jgi:hypothetical protein